MSAIHKVLEVPGSTPRDVIQRFALKLGLVEGTHMRAIVGDLLEAFVGCVEKDPGKRPDLEEILQLSSKEVPLGFEQSKISTGAMVSPGQPLFLFHFLFCF